MLLRACENCNMWMINQRLSFRRNTLHCVRCATFYCTIPSGLDRQGKCTQRHCVIDVLGSSDRFHINPWCWRRRENFPTRLFCKGINIFQKQMMLGKKFFPSCGTAKGKLKFMERIAGWIFFSEDSETIFSVTSSRRSRDECKAFINQVDE